MIRIGTIQTKKNDLTLIQAVRTVSKTILGISRLTNTKSGT